MRRSITIIALLSLAGCRDCDPVLQQVPVATDQVDVFEQKAAAKVDILWMVDNSESMATEQDKIADRFNQFFNQLITSQVDYHIGVVTTDSADNGVLQQYDGPAVDGCAACRFVTNEVPCENPAVDVSGLTNEAQIESTLQAECPAQLVFRKLVTVGINGSSFEQGFQSVAMALGAHDVDPATGLPLNNPPPENAGFIRPDAALYIIFVSDEEEGAKRDGSPIRYYQRLFEGLKGAGNENKVAVAAITGYPTDDGSLPPISEVCPVLETTFDGSVANDDARAAVLKEALRNFDNGCLDESDPDELGFAETGGRYIELACRTGGVVANMCSADYSDALDALGANAAGLLRKFALSKSSPEIANGDDCVLFGPQDDDQFLDCDENGDSNDDLDGPICVTAQCLGESAPRLIPQDGVNGWVYEASTNSIRFNGSCVPAPNSTVHIRYPVRAERDTQCGG